MTSLITLIIIASLSLLVTRIASILLEFTGLSKDIASFQARSAFTGVGFTTIESEKIMNHPFRRRVIKTLMLIGNIGIISAMATLILTFVSKEATSRFWYLKLGILAGSIVILWLLASWKFLEKKLEKLVKKMANKYVPLKTHDYVNLLHLSENYDIYEMVVEENDWFANRKLSELNLNSEGVNLLGIKKNNGDYIGVPNGETGMEIGDKLILCGRDKVLQNLNVRKSGPEGEKDHKKAQYHQLRVERRLEQERKRRGFNQR